MTPEYNTVNPFIYSIEDVANRLNVCPRTIYYRIKTRGLFAAKKIGRRIYFSQDVFASPLGVPG